MAIQSLCDALHQVADIELFKILCWDIIIIRICRINETLSKSAIYNTVSIDTMLSSTNQKDEILDLMKTMSNSVAKKKYEHNHNTRNVRLDMAIAYMHQHFKENISRASVAKNIYISPSYLSFIFKENLHQSFSEYLLQIRINQSEKLLRDPSIKISNVAEMVGIEDAQYFSKVFKKIHGITLSEYRKKYL